MQGSGWLCLRQAGPNPDFHNVKQRVGSFERFLRISDFQVVCMDSALA